MFGFSEDVLAVLSGAVWGTSSVGLDEKEARRAGLDPAEPRLKKALTLAGELTGFPRHLSQHTGGFVITRTRLDEVVPLAHATMEGRTTVQWDKDDLDALGILKVDILALGMLTCLAHGFDLLTTHYGLSHGLADVPAEEKSVYDMISRADTIGVFQIESRGANVHAAAPETCHLLRSCHRSGDRAAGAHPGRHWCIPICAAGRGWRRSNIRRMN